MKFSILKLVRFAVIFAATPAALATTWYVNGVSGNDGNNCLISTAACKTIGHAIALARSGDSVRVARATYKENLFIGFSLNVIGAGAATTVIDGGGINCPAQFSFTGCTVITISPARTATVVISGLTIRNGSPQYSMLGSDGDGGGINNNGTLIINNSTVSGNVANGGFCTFAPPRLCSGGAGAGIASSGTLTVNNSTVSGNVATIPPWFRGPFCKTNRCFPGSGGGISGSGTLTVNNSTVSGNFSGFGGGILTNSGALTISSSTISGNSGGGSGGIAAVGGTVKIQNSILANSTVYGNCSGTMTSDGYNLSSDRTCNFNGPGDMNNINPLLGTLGNNGGPTQTIPLLPGSPAIDAGNPSGCTDGQGHLLKTDQRGMPRPDPEDTGGCDIGAYERQKD